MKKIIALVAAVLSLSLATAQEQNTATTPVQTQKPKGPKPEMMAQRHSQHLQKLLALTEDQTKKTYDALLTRFTEGHAIREKAGDNVDKKAMREQLKPVRQKYVQTMGTILTAEQKTKWEEHRKQMKKNRMMRKDANMKTEPAKGDANGDMKKLTDDEDGLDD